MIIEKNKFFWLVDTRPIYFEISLKKLNLSQDGINYFLNNENIAKGVFYNRKNKIYIAPNDHDNIGNGRYSWEDYKPNGKFLYEKLGFIYKGEVKVTEEEIAEYKYNL